MPNRLNLKRLLSLILIITFFLPLSKCSVPTPSTDRVKTVVTAEMVTIIIGDNYLEKFDTSLLLVFICFWGLGILNLLGYFYKIKYLYNFMIEILLLIYSTVVIISISIYGNFLIGFYLASSVVASYFLVAIYDYIMNQRGQSLGGPNQRGVRPSKVNNSSG